MLKKLEKLLRQLNGFRDAILSQQKSIKAKMKAADDQAKGVGQFTPLEPNQSKVDLAKGRERVEELDRRINEGFDATEADALQPDRPRYRTLRAKGPTGSRASAETRSAPAPPSALP